MDGDGRGGGRCGKCRGLSERRGGDGRDAKDGPWMARDGGSWERRMEMEGDGGWRGMDADGGGWVEMGGDGVYRGGCRGCMELCGDGDGWS